MNWRRYVVVLCLLFAVVSSGGAQQADGDYTIHVVQRGENLFRIALGYGLTTDQLAGINGISDPASIQVGQRLLVPVTVGEVSSSTDTVAPAHTVEPGETLDSIAGLYGVSLDSVIAANPDINPAALTVGQVISIPETTATTVNNTDADEVVAVDTTSTTSTTSVDTLPTTEMIHTVEAGETLFRIATQYGLTVNDLSAANSITDPTHIYSGQQLIIPGIEPPQLTSNLPAPLTALFLSPPVLIEGKTGYLELRADAGVTITGQFLGQSLQAVPVSGGVYRMFVGIPVFTEPGVYPLVLQVTPDGGAAISIDANVQVIQGPYGSETIQLIEGRDVLLNNNVEDAELELLDRVVSPFTAERYIQGTMSLPAAAAITSGFGTRRSYNGGAYDRYHSGTDFAGVPGTPILAPAPGQVVLADTLNVRGNATVLDHGWGIYTGYWHQTELYVGLGDMVETGQVIGTIGSTGRVTGAHLHWELWVNGVTVDPMQWVQQPFVTLE